MRKLKKIFAFDKKLLLELLKFCEKYGKIVLTRRDNLFIRGSTIKIWEDLL